MHGSSIVWQSKLLGLLQKGSSSFYKIMPIAQTIIYLMDRFNDVNNCCSTIDRSSCMAKDNMMLIRAKMIR